MRKRIAPRILANRLNAKKSTGPKSKSGKQRSAQNAISHGLFKANPFIYQNLDNHDNLILLIGSNPTPEIIIAAEEVIRLRSKLTIIRNIKAQLYFEIDDLFKSQKYFIKTCANFVNRKIAGEHASIDAKQFNQRFNNLAIGFSSPRLIWNSDARNFD